ncbi:hypothetical protein [Treponema pectinovorum]|uniref:hypothetical protein n=1 Tax=Treponema pectinovorum TaxID=164 RepID=UPI0011CA50B4|nr:hypothetical protein [Treponema pectinovorum]
MIKPCKKIFLLFFLGFSVSIFFSCSSKSNFDLSFAPYSEQSSGHETSYKNSKLKKINKASLKAYYFSPLQNQYLTQYAKERKNAGLLLRFFVKKTKKSQANENSIEQEFDADFLNEKTDSASFGFLYKTALSSSNLKSELKKDRPIVSINFNDFEGETFDVLFSISNERELPLGFFIDSKEKISILNCQIQAACSGFDFSGDIPFFAFGPSGGKLQKNVKNVDLRSLSQCFVTQNSNENLMPSLEVSFYKNLEQSNTFSELIIGGEKLSIKKNEGGNFSIPLASLKYPYSIVELSKNSKNLSSVLLKESDTNLLKKSSFVKNSPIVPIKIDPGLIIKWDKKNWRTKDYELFEWDRFDNVLCFDTANYSVQDDFFLRLAFFTEKKGYKGRLLTDKELSDMHGYNAHDYKAYDLARFFDLAQKQNFSLNEKERLLKEILLENGVIGVDDKGNIQEGRGAVISLSQENQPYLRPVFLAHESWHGIFFVDEDFRNTTASIYYSLMASEPMALNFLLKYFQVTPSLNYDTNDEYLMKNEFMAYMLQRPVSYCEKYYVDMASRAHAQKFIKEESDYIIQTKAAGFVGCAQMFEEYVGNRWNLAAGRVWLISR